VAGGGVGRGESVGGVETRLGGVTGSSFASDCVPPRDEGVWLSRRTEDARGISVAPYRQHRREDGDVAVKLRAGEGGGDGVIGGAPTSGGAVALADQWEGHRPRRVMFDDYNLTSDA
jgi:hypothetical protein